MTASPAHWLIPGEQRMRTLPLRALIKALPVPLHRMTNHPPYLFQED